MTVSVVKTPKTNPLNVCRFLVRRFSPAIFQITIFLYLFLLFWWKNITIFLFLWLSEIIFSWFTNIEKSSFSCPESIFCLSQKSASLDWSWLLIFIHSRIESKYYSRPITPFYDGAFFPENSYFTVLMTSYGLLNTETETDSWSRNLVRETIKVMNFENFAHINFLM